MEQVFHQLWTKAVGTDGYDKKQWQDLEQMIIQQSKPLTFEKVSKYNLERCNIWHNINDWTLADWLTATCGELGELANVVKKMKRYEQNIQSNNNILPADFALKLSEEIGGTFLYLDLFTQRAGLQLIDVIPYEFNRVSTREKFSIFL